MLCDICVHATLRDTRAYTLLPIYRDLDSYIRRPIKRPIQLCKETYAMSCNICVHAKLHDTRAYTLLPIYRDLYSYIKRPMQGNPGVTRHMRMCTLI